MKVLRVMFLTTVLFAGATTRSNPTPTPAPVAAQTGPGDCYIVNGVWFCD